MAARRGPGEGSIFRRTDGLWAAQVTLGRGPGGRRVRRTFYGKTRRQVHEKLSAAVRDVQQGTLPSSGRETLGQYLASWLEGSARARLRPKTFSGYRSLILQHVSPRIGHIRLERLRPQDVQALLNAKADEGLSPRSVDYIRAVLRTALNQAVKWGMVPRNVASLTDPPHVIREPIRPLTPEEARRLLNAAGSDRLEALYTVALSLGLRQGEALGLRWDDIDLDGGTLAVRYALQRVDGKLELVEPKTTRSRRTIHMPAVVVDALRQHRARQLQERLLAGARWQDTGFIFTSTLGTPLDGSNVTRRFHGLLAQAGLRRVRFHDLRHSCASLLLAQRVPARVVMETLGHSTINLTMNTYSHVIPALQKEAADAMDRLLKG